MNKKNKRVLWFKDVSNDDVELVGGKNASLGEMYQTLSKEGIQVPNGFIVTAYAYREFIKDVGLDVVIRKELEAMDINNTRSLQETGKKVRNLIKNAEFPKELTDEIQQAYSYFLKKNGSKCSVAVRSSATAEDLPGASFAGEHETYLNVSGHKNVLKAIKMAMASLFNDRAISYRVHKGFGHFDVALSVGIQLMVRSDKGSSGVMFTLDTESGFRDMVQISAAWGLGEMVVQGKVNPDEYMVFKPTLKKKFSPIVKQSLGAKRRKMIYAAKNASNPVKEVNTTTKEKEAYVLNKNEILTLARWGSIIEKHYTKRYKKDTPMDIEWAKDGITGNLYIVQARPETVQSEKDQLRITEYNLTTDKKPLVEGIAVGTKIASGKARVISSVKGIHDFKDGEVLVTKITDPDWEPIMKRASAIITERGGRTSHAAIVSRELGIPAVIGAPKAMDTIPSGTTVTADTSSGTVGSVYKGKLEWSEHTHEIASIPKTRTKVSMNIGSPDSALMYSRIPNDGVGLAREEFIIASHIKVHPKALINYNDLSPTLKRSIDSVTLGYDDKIDYFVDKLAEGVGQIAAAFYPNEVIVRFSDFKSNEYATLLGGKMYEPEEENPMIGWRGASRYAHPEFTDAFALECKAMKKIREEFGLDNLSVMVPFCRTPEEGKQVLGIMEKEGLKRGKNGLRVHVMCELPTNIIRADEFLDLFDGFSIGSNDLAQLTLGLDRDSSIVAGISNENDPAVRESVARAIKICKKRKKYIGFCGQAPSDYKDFLRFLIQQRIDSVSLIPDTIIPMKFEIEKEEKRQKKTKSKK